MIATERRTRDVELGEHIRLIGDEEPFGVVVGMEHMGDDVFLTVVYPRDGRPSLPVDLPVMDGDDVVEVLA